MKIYDVENFPNPLRVRIALAEKNAIDKVEFVAVDLLNGEHREEAFLAKNPLAGVPVLELDDGTFIAECTAITEYIDTAFDGISLMGVGAKSRAVINMMQKRAESMVLDAVATYFHHATAGLGPELETNQNATWGQAQKDKANAGLIYFNEVLAGSEFVAGNEFSIADITLFAGLVFAGFAQITIPSQLTHLLAWQEKMAKRDSISA
ncbi:glutathione S-transferase [Pseudoalteromonas sp. MMG010]|uniref:glutathione S-transferase family protein n=1 Tax=Pseudoalteromonas sp. MMG010 TaxID=2822685 RepID=UPI001B3A6955|nr:glutathione S-transferase [Pseudoalteromonas sp. MMG010]MBQ4833808.1 glutathione S-transferase [Pseudoalteromonas sp. MMG010]